MLNTSYENIKKRIKPKLATIYTGPPDAFFNFKYETRLRSLEFKFKTSRQKKYKCVQINFPNDKKYTRKVEIKHVTRQKSQYTTLSYEFPNSKGDPITQSIIIKMIKV